MLRNTRKRLRQFFALRMPSCSSIFRPTTRSQRARSAPPGYRTSERPLRDAFHRPGGHAKGPEASVIVPPLDRTANDSATHDCHPARNLCILQLFSSGLKGTFRLPE